MGSSKPLFSPPMTASWIFAPAKINLSLRVGPPLANGRHPLDSLVCFTRSIGDEISFSPGSSLTLNINGPFAEGLSSNDDNLVLAAARLIQDGARAGAALTLTKRLPIASGIGGGSADAAATLIGLNEMWQRGLTRPELHALGARLGADVPACLMGSALRMARTGEAIEAVTNVPRLGIVLVNPLIDCPTGPVYRRYDELARFSGPAIDPLPDLSSVGALLAFLRANPNDLEAAAMCLVPQIGDLLAAIGETDDVLLARMSGSGATCFGLYPDKATAQTAAEAIRNTLASFPIWVEADEIN
jgi:4-diphosphocytidyl-2-C-methyl-D-erythritol kinase